MPPWHSPDASVLYQPNSRARLSASLQSKGFRHTLLRLQGSTGWTTLQGLIPPSALSTLPPWPQPLLPVSWVGPTGANWGRGAWTIA